MEKELSGEWETVDGDVTALVPLTPNEVIQRRAIMIRIIRDAMKVGRDYGIIPGTDKLSLWKSGAEKLCNAFGFSAQVVPVESVLDWTGKDHGSEPFFFFRHKCTIRHGARLIVETEASCNSWEKKYRWREGKRICPKCKKETIYRSRPRPNDPPDKEQGWYCWTKKGGCGAQFSAGDKDISSQSVGMVKNDEIFDQVNTVQKMSEKRAFVGSTIISCNAGEFFALNLESEDDDEETGNARPVYHQETKDVQQSRAAASASLYGNGEGLDTGPSLESLDSLQLQPTKQDRGPFLVGQD